MGFFAGELEALLMVHQPQSERSPWLLLTDIGVHPQQIERLKKACEDLALVASLPENQLQQLRQTLAATPIEWARLQAANEADIFLRLLLYHNYPLEEAANKANSLFAAKLKDLLATGGNAESIYPQLSEANVDAINRNQSPKGHQVRRRTLVSPPAK